MIAKVAFLTLILFCSTVIAYQDIKTREISVWVICLLLLGSVFKVLLVNGKFELLSNFLSTFFFVLLWLMLSFLVVFVREKKFVNIIDSRLGLGDILILFALGISLDLISLIVFTTVTAILSLIFSYKLIKKNKTIPFAGIAMICFVVLELRALIDFS